MCIARHVACGYPVWRACHDQPRVHNLLYLWYGVRVMISLVCCEVEVETQRILHRAEHMGQSTWGRAHGDTWHRAEHMGNGIGECSMGSRGIGVHAMGARAATMLQSTIQTHYTSHDTLHIARHTAHRTTHYTKHATLHAALHGACCTPHCTAHAAQRTARRMPHCTTHDSLHGARCKKRRTLHMACLRPAWCS